MDKRVRLTIIITSILFIISIIAVVVYLLLPKLPSTQNSDKTVIIDNYGDYTRYISSDSFGTLGNYLYEFIDKPSQGVYHARIVDGSYNYDPNSWFSTFTVKVENSDISWNISLQTINGGKINGDISIKCASGAACLSLSTRMNSPTLLQDHLPLNSDDFIISSQKDNYGALSIIYYDQEGTGKTKALEKIMSLGFKPEDYTINYYYGGR